MLQFIKLGRRLLGKTLFEKAMKASFYGQFVAGEDAVRIRPLLERNMSFGVKSILDYSVEMDISTEEAKKAEIKYGYDWSLCQIRQMSFAGCLNYINSRIHEIRLEIFVLY